MMKTFVTLAAFAAGSNALVGRGDSCCFHITASGGASGSVGQLSDGQNRIGDNSLSPAQYCINSSGGITDSNGRGCILTPPTTQFQCDEGASPTTGFSVGSSGQLEYNGSPQFIACETGQNNGLNIYTKNSTDVTQCVNVNLKADSCSGSGSGAGAGASSSSVPAMSSSVSTPAQSASASSAPASSAPASSAPASSAPASSAPGVPGGPASSAQCLTGSPVTTTVTVTDCACATSGASAPGGGGSTAPSSSVPAGAGGGGSYPSGSSSMIPSGPTGGSQATSSVVSTPSGPAGGAHSSTPAGGSQSSTMTSVPASSASGTHSTATAHGSCPTTLSSGNYQYPHLIIPVDSASPSTAPGTSYNGTVTSSISSIFNFDIPQAYSDKTCSLVFLFPKKADLETSSYSFSGDGKIDVSKLSAVASESTSYSNAPSVAQDLGDITISPGNGYVVSTFACPAGETIAFEMKNAGSTNLNFFEDWNPSPLGLFITSC